MNRLDPVRNNAKAKLASGIAETDTALTVENGQGALFPDPAVDGAFNLVLWESGNFADPTDDPDKEIVRVTARSGDTMTIERAQEGTADVDHNTPQVEYTVVLSLTQKSWEDIDDALGEIDEELDEKLSVLQYAETLPFLFPRSIGQPVSINSGLAYPAFASNDYPSTFRQSIGLATEGVLDADMPYPVILKSQAYTVSSSGTFSLTIDDVPANANVILLAAYNEGLNGNLGTGWTLFSGASTNNHRSGYQLIGSHAGGNISFNIFNAAGSGRALTVVAVGNAAQSAPTVLDTYAGQSTKSPSATQKRRLFTLLADSTATDITASTQPQDRLQHLATAGRSAIFTTPSYLTGTITQTYSRNVQGTLCEIAPATALDFPEAKVALAGVVGGQSGLTLRAKYYVANNGTLATSAGANSLPVGFAPKPDILMLHQL